MIPLKPTVLIFLLVIFIFSSCGVIRISYNPEQNDQPTINSYHEFKEMKAREFEAKYPPSPTDYYEPTPYDKPPPYVFSPTLIQRAPILNSCIDEAGAYKGPCQTNIDFVCGCDGVTYSNGCEASQRGVRSYTRGRCKDR
jgi:hypothetical protein